MPAYSRQAVSRILLAVSLCSMQPNTEVESESGIRGVGAGPTGMIRSAAHTMVPSWTGFHPAWLDRCRRQKCPSSALAHRVRTGLTGRPRSVSPPVPLDRRQDTSRRRAIPATPRRRSSVLARDGYAEACAPAFDSVAQLVIAVALASALSGCTGGGGSEPPSDDGPPPCAGIETADHGCLSQDEFARQRDEISDEFLTDGEFLSQSALELIGTHEAYANLQVVQGREVEPGAGTTVAVMDSGFVVDHPELDGARFSATILQQTSNGADFSHGTAVASIIAAKRDGRGFAGIAWGADVRGFAIPLDDEQALRSFDWAEAFRTVLASGADIVNMSYAASETFVENFDAQDLRDSPFGSEFEAMAQMGVADPVLFVRAAGNDHGERCELGLRGVENCTPDPSNPSRGKYVASSPNLDSGAVALLGELQGHVVVVVAVDGGGQIAPHSNRCGIAGPWCIAAPGEDIRLAYSDDQRNTLGRGTGTSFAAPFVSGGLALIKQFFRGQLTNPDLLERVFATADKSGAYGNMNAYGQGLLDLGAAVSPVGSARVAAGSSVGDSGPDIRVSGLQVGSSFGDAWSQSFAGREIAAFDALGAPFWFDLSRLAGTVRAMPARARLRNLLSSEWDEEPETRSSGAPTASSSGGGWRFGFRTTPEDARHSLLGVARNVAALTLEAAGDFEATTFTTADAARRGSAEMGAALAWRPRGGPVRFRLGWLGERATLLGSRASGAFGRLAANSVVAGFEVGTALQGWRVEAAVEWGRVSPEATGGMVQDMSPLTTTAFSVGAHRRVASGFVKVSVSQPLRVERGSADFSLPVGRTKDGAVLHDNLTARLVPSGRQIDFAVRWLRPRVYGGEFRAEAAVSRHPDHVSTSPELSLLAGWVRGI